LAPGPERVCQADGKQDDGDLGGMWTELDEFVTEASSRPLDFVPVTWAVDWGRRLGFACQQEAGQFWIRHVRSAPDLRAEKREYLKSGEASIAVVGHFDEPAVAVSELMLAVAMALSFHNGSVSVRGYQGNWRTPYGATYALQTAQFAQSILDRLVRRATCFISYSTLDSAFTSALTSALHRDGYRTWYAPERMRGGSEINRQVQDAIATHDRFLLVVSPSSMRSPWVALELRSVLAEEARTGVRKLFPIRICGMESVSQWRCVVDGADLAEDVRRYFIPDFTRWREPEEWGTLLSELSQILAGHEGP
jgi:hypothetical protein